MGKSTSFISLFLWAVRVVNAAVDLDGEQVVEPATGKDDASPISDPEQYFPNQASCPLQCDDFSNVNSWTPYFSINRLKQCDLPMLLKFSIAQPLDDPQTTVLIRSCSLGSPSTVNLTGTPSEVDNPKKDDSLYRPRLDSAPACFTPGKETSTGLDVATSGDSALSGKTDYPKLLQGLQSYFADEDNCDERTIFGYYRNVVAGVYVGPGLGKGTVPSVFKALEQVRAGRSVAQVCGGNRTSDRIFGVAVGSNGDLAAVQKSVAGWSNGECAKSDLTSLSNAGSVGVFEIAKSSGDVTGITNSTSSSNSTSSTSSGLISTSSGSSKSAASSAASSGSITGTSSKSIDVSSTSSATAKTTSSVSAFSLLRLFRRSEDLEKRATCKYVQVADGDSCDSLAKKCGISGDEFMKYNSQSGFCSGLQPGDYACCSSGDRYKPEAPKANADGTCATYLIQDGDSCQKLAKSNGITTDDIEKWNKGRVWAWTECSKMLLGYNMCLSPGNPPLPPPQQGAECGPIVPGTVAPSGNYSLADLNPCPLKACCSNWGFCGPFSAHCDIHAPPGGGPGTKLPGFEATCVSNCGNEIKQNSGPPAAFSRIGYYESWNLDRDCLWLKAKDANTDGTYTHIHWGFLEIDSNSWKPVIVDKKSQWADFKALTGVKRIASFGGWAYSTEPATYNIIRKAIIDNRETFATNVAQFVKDEGIDGIDIDWEYPGAPDIMVNGSPIGQKGDGVAYLRFLTSLKQKMGSKSVSIAAPASYWYLKAFPIDRIAAVIDYIVYMTYDLHGQWDYGNVNAFDACPSGKCIRSHVNLTETRNSLAIITKAGVPNNKIFVGESSYGRSFHMAVDGCWGPMCEFTGSRIQSDAKPGRCTKTSGYISNAEIDDLIRSGGKVFHDDASNTDVMLINGDYISYMTTTTKDTRRNDWKGLNFAGSIDWAVDLQRFGAADVERPANNGKAGSQGCIAGDDLTINTGFLCAFTCTFDFCPETWCACTDRGEIPALPGEVGGQEDIIAWDENDADMNRLCIFACKYGYCPKEYCYMPEPDEEEDGSVNQVDPNTNPVGFDYEAARQANRENCLVPRYHGVVDLQFQCYDFCKPKTDAAKAEGRTTNYGCLGFWPLDQPIPWQKVAGFPVEVAGGKCLCDNWLLNEIADFIMEALPIIAQIGCYIIMQSLKTLVDIGLEFFTGGAGRALSSGMDMITTAAQMTSYIYPPGEDPKGSFEWWLSPCGNLEYVPDSIKNAFDIINQAVSLGTDIKSSFKPPKNIPKGSGRKGDDGNPKDQSKPRGGTGSNSKPNTPNTPSTPSAPKKPRGRGAQKGCARAPAGQIKESQQDNTFVYRVSSCNKQKKWESTDYIVTSVTYPANPKTISVVGDCPADATQACYHYSSAIAQHPTWSKIMCPPEAGQAGERREGRAQGLWHTQHDGAGWKDAAQKPVKLYDVKGCQADEYPPAYLNAAGRDYTDYSGVDSRGQMIRYLPGTENGKAGAIWKGACFLSTMKQSRYPNGLSEAEFGRRAKLSGRRVQAPGGSAWYKKYYVDMDVDGRPEWSINPNTWPQGATGGGDGLAQNPCWPSANAKGDPGFALMNYDQYYKGAAPPYNYRAKMP